MQRWAVEWSGTGQLGGQGITRETLRVGDQIVDRRPAVARAGRVPAADGQPEAARSTASAGARGRAKPLTDVVHARANARAEDLR